MASKEPSAMSKIPKLRSAPCSPRVTPKTPSPPVKRVHPPPPASMGKPNPIFEKSRSNVTNSSRIPQLAKASFQKRTSSSIPSSKIPQAPISKIPRRGVASIGHKATARDLPQPKCFDEALSEVAPVLELEPPPEKSHGHTPLLGHSEQLAPVRKSQSGSGDRITPEEVQNPLVGQIQSPSSDHDIALPVIQELSRSSSILVGEVDLKPESKGPVEEMFIPDTLSLLHAETLIDEVAKSAAQKSLEVSPQHVQRDLLSVYLHRDSRSSAPSLVSNPCFTWSTTEGNYTDTIEVIRAPKSQTGTVVESQEDFGKMSPASAHPREGSHNVSRTNSYLKNYQEEVQEAQNEIRRLHSQETETQASTSLGYPETLEGQLYPFSYDPSFQLRNVSDDPTVEDIQDPLQDDEPIETMPTEDYEDTCGETDYSFCGEEEEDEEMEDSESGVDQDGDNDELILSTMIHSIANDGQGSNRKTKTIFSVDAPLAYDQKDSGPGVNGDGHEAHHLSSSIRLVSSSTTRAKKEVEVLYRKQEEPRPPIVEEADDVDVNTEVDNEEGTIQQEKCPRIRAVNGCIEILPQLDEARRCSSTGMEGSRKFSMILLRSSEGIGKTFEKSLQICNLTGVSYGFKVWCNSNAYSHLDIKPSLGLIMSGRQLTVKINTRGSLEHEMKRDMDNDQIEVRIFKAYTDDPVRLQDCYEKLMEQRPDLVATQPVDRLILWDAGDISGRLELFQSINDEEEQSELKEELHNIQLGEFPSQTMMMTRLPLSNSPTGKESLLRQIREQLRITDFSIKESLTEMVNIRNIQQSIFFMIFLGLAGSLLLPREVPEDLRHQAPVENPEAPSSWTSLLNKLGLN